MNENEVVSEVVNMTTGTDPELLAKANEELLTKALVTTLGDAAPAVSQPKPVSLGVQIGVGVGAFAGGIAVGAAIDHWVVPKLSAALTKAKENRAKKKAEKKAKKEAKKAAANQENKPAVPEPAPATTTDAPDPRVYDTTIDKKD